MLWLYSVGLYKLSFSIGAISNGKYVIYLVQAYYVCRAKLHAAGFSEACTSSLNQYKIFLDFISNQFGI